MSTASTPARRRSPPPVLARQDTATYMLEVAERLFAEQGVEGVPLHRIVVASGQKNRSAMHYHFGSRSDVVAHLLNLRLAHVNALRHVHIDALVSEGRAHDVRSLVGAAVLPLFETVRDTPWGRHYVQVMAQTTFSPQLLSADLIEKDNISALQRVRTLLGEALPAIPPMLLDQRATWVTDNAVFSIARWVRDASGALRVAGSLDDLLDYCTGGLTAPVSAAAATNPPARAKSGLTRHFR